MSVDPPKRAPASVEALPNELLSKIFHIVRDHSLAQFREPPKDDPYDKEWFFRPEFTSPWSPVSLAQVSSRWHSIITTIPEFRTILVLSINTAKQISLSDVQAFLDQSLELPLDILVTRHPKSREPTSEEEQSRLLPLIKLLTPYFPRCRSIAFHTIYDSALPKLGRDITGELPNLIDLKLECQINDARIEDIPLELQPINFPSLDKLVIDGYNFTVITSMDREWPIRFPKLKSLSIVNLSSKPEAAIQAISLYDFLEVLAGESMHLDFLRFRDAELTNPFSEEFSVNLTLSKALVLENLHRSFVQELLVSVVVQTPELQITHCSLNAMGRVPTTAILHLEDIAESDDLSNHLTNWSGSSLTLNFCDGCNDNFLDMLAKVSTFSGAPDLVKLTIVDCPNFTLEALKKMVEARSKAKKGAIEGLVVNGRGPALDAAGASWFKGQLKSFEWNTWTENGDFVYM